MQAGCSPGTMTIDGDYEQAETGTLVLFIAGLEPERFSVWQVNVNAVLAGKVDLQFIDGFVPKPRDHVNFVQVSGEIAGKLTGDTLLDVPGGAANGPIAAQATVTWKLTPDGTC